MPELDTRSSDIMASPRERVNEILKQLGSDYQAQPYDRIEESFAALFEAIGKKFKELANELRRNSR
jgi:hypothetical protein